MLASTLHGVTKGTLRLASAVVLAAAAHGGLAPALAADPPAWPTSPFHGVISGATGEPIPCRCRFQGAAYKLGDTVCMTTHLGVQFARCDLFLNNTSWVPTGMPCTMSHLQSRRLSLAPQSGN